MNVKEHLFYYEYEAEDAMRVDPYTDMPYFADACVLGYATRQEALEFLFTIASRIPTGLTADVYEDIDFAPPTRRWCVMIADADESCPQNVSHISDLPATLALVSS